MLAAAEADFQPERAGGDGKGGMRVGGLFEREAQPWQRLVQQKLLAGAQRMAALAPVQPIRLRLDRITD